MLWTLSVTFDWLGVVMLCKIMKELEKDIQKAIIDYLRMTGCFVYKNRSVGIYKTATGSYIPSQTVGVADLTAIKKGIVYQLEVKTSTGKQSPGQQQFQKDWEEHGGKYFITRSIDDVIKLINI